MSDTIQARHHSPGQLALPRAGALIAAAATRRDAALPPQQMPAREAGRRSADVIGTGTARAVVLVDVDRATSAAEATLALDDYNADAWLRWAETTKVALQRSSPAGKPAPSAAARLRVARLAAIQAVFGLPTLEMAQVLGITRQGLYKWLDALKDVRLQAAGRERLALVERISKQWRQRTTAPLGTVVREPLADGRTVLDLLVAGHVDEAAVGGAFDELVAKLHGRPRSRSQKLADAGFKRRPSPRALPADE